MDEAGKIQSDPSSAAAFVEGGIQDACDDSCSICLEDFCDSEPSTVTGCKHEFHLQCILEWCQRSSQCPMCWQPISLKDPTSQELLEAVVQERNARANRSRSAAVFHHPILGDFEFQHIPIDADEAELRERFIQHLAAAAATHRTHRGALREGQNSRSSSRGRQQILVFSTQEPTIDVTMPADSDRSEDENEMTFPDVSTISLADHAASGRRIMDEDVPPNTGHPGQTAAVPSSHSESVVSMPDASGIRAHIGQPNPANPQRAGPSDLHSLSDSLKARIQSVSTRYKESFANRTRGWRERLFSRSTSISDLSSEVRREVDAGIAAVSRMMERLETRDGVRPSASSSPAGAQNGSVNNTRVIRTNAADVRDVSS